MCKGACAGETQRCMGGGRRVRWCFWAGGVIAWLVLPACCLTSGEVNFGRQLQFLRFFPHPPPFFTASSELHFG